MKLPLGPLVTAPVVVCVGTSQRPPWRGGRGVSVKTTSCRNTARGRRRGPSRGPRPAPLPVVALRRTTGPVAEEWCVLGTFPFKPKPLDGATRPLRLALCSDRARSLLGCGSARGARLRTSTLRAAVVYAVRGRREQFHSIHLDPLGVRADDRGLAGRRQPSPRRAEDRRSRRRRGATECSSPRASSRATGARRRRTRPGSIPTRRCRRRGRRRGPSRMLMISSSRHNQ